MSYVAQNSRPDRAVDTVVGPVAPRRRRVGASLGAFVASNFLTRYPDGSHLSTLQGYQSSPLRRFENGQPLSDVASSSVPKSMLVLMAYQRAMNNKCGMSGLGDDNTDWTDSGASLPGDPAPLEDTGVVLYPGDQAPGWSAPSIPAMSTVAGAPIIQNPANTFGGALSNLLSSLFRPAASYGTVPAYATFGSSLAQPIAPGAPVSMGGVLAIAGIGLFTVLLLKRR